MQRAMRKLGVRMSLLDDILVWAGATLNPWQRDAMRRLLLCADLTQDDFEDLFAMLKSSHGLPDDKNRTPVPLAQEHLPAPATPAAPISLVSLRDLKNVNRIATGQKLAFSPTGMTIVYGGNGSGKSGYARVLKRACRARDSSETVHPNAFDVAAAKNIPEAIFEVNIGGTLRSLIWKRDSASPDELSSIAVFDGKCARAYLDDEQDVAYLPYGLDIVENLGQRVLPELSRRLNADIAAVNIDSAPFADLRGETVVGKLVMALSASTDPLKVTALATLSAEETTRLAELDKTLAEQDPLAKAKLLRQAAQRIDALVTRIDGAVAWAADPAVEKLKLIDSEAEAATAVASAAAARFRAADALLPGTGEAAWKTLVDAARHFSTEQAYPNEPFPKVDQDARCLLCQQPLAQDGAERMRRFEEFVQQDTAKTAAQKGQQRNTAIQKIEAAALAFGLDDALIAELESLNADVLNATREFEGRVDVRRRWMLDSVTTHKWDAPPAIDGDARPELKSLSAGLTAQAIGFEKAADQAKKKALESERAELRSRVNLSLRKQPILELIARMKLNAILTKCKDDLKTTAISNKSKEFASRAVTSALKNALDAEFQALGVGHIKTKLNERVAQGKMKHKLVLELSVTRKLDEVLSEGEQRGIAIGSFLAELHLAGHRGGIVFDDPVSSLDHYRRRDVARRVVTEAKSRQVIILTHDTVFLAELLQEIETQGVEFLVHHVEWAGSFAGHVNDGLPWEHQPYKDRLDKLGKAQRELEKRWPPYPNATEAADMRQQYDRLRATIERVIQDVVFNGVVQRYRDWIKVDKHLQAVVGFSEAECNEIARLHKTCCDVVTAHDPSSAKIAPVPTAIQLGKDIADLEAVITAIKKRRSGPVVGAAPAAAAAS